MAIIEPLTVKNKIAHYTYVFHSNTELIAILKEIDGYTANRHSKRLVENRCAKGVVVTSLEYDADEEEFLNQYTIIDLDDIKKAFNLGENNG